MEERISVHGSPENSVFGLKGSDVDTDEGKFYIKVSDDSKNIGWKEIPPTPTPTQTISITPSKTMIVTRTPRATYIPPTPTPTITNSPSMTPSATIGVTHTPTPSPTNTPFRTSVNYRIISNDVAFGTAEVIGGPSTGTISVNGQLTLKATVSDGRHFEGWTVPEFVQIFDSIYRLNPVIRLLSTSGGDITITGNFADGLLELYYIDGTADSFGRLVFDYIDNIGEQQRYENTGLAPGETLSGAVCGNRIISTSYGETTNTYILC